MLLQYKTEINYRTQYYIYKKQVRAICYGETV